MRFMMVVSPAAATGRACSGAPCLITYQSGPIRMEARLREIQRESKGKAEAHAQQNCFTCAHIIMSLSASRSSGLWLPRRNRVHGRRWLPRGSSRLARLDWRRASDQDGQRIRHRDHPRDSEDQR